MPLTMEYIVPKAVEQYNPLQSHETYRRSIQQSLEVAASSDDPAGVVTLLTQVSTDSNIRDTMRAFALAHAQRMMAVFTRRLCHGEKFTEVEFSDFQTIVRLLREQAPAIQEQEVGPFRCCFVPGRNERPPGETGQLRRHLYEPFDARKFYFDPDKQANFFVSIDEIQGVETGIYLQKFAFAPGGHTLACPHVSKHLPQYLTADLFDWACAFARNGLLQGMKLAYNCLSGGASVNHLHFHLFCDQLPIEASRFKFNGGADVYSVQVVALSIDECEKAHCLLAHLNQADLAYNLLLTPERLYFMIRQKHGAYSRSAWSSGFAVYEMCGVILLTNRADFERLTLADIEGEFAKLRL